MSSISRKRLTEIFLALQTLVITFVLYWTYAENVSNAFFRSWLSQNFPLVLSLLNEWVVGAAITGLLLVTGYWIIQLEGEGRRRRVKGRPPRKSPILLETETVQVPPGLTVAKRRPIYETVEMRSFIILLILATHAISLWFVTASTFRVTMFSATSFYYYSHLPFTYWWGLSATLAMFFTRPNHQGRARTGLEISTLFILAFYLIGLSLFSYQDPRFIDPHSHIVNSLSLLTYQDCLTA